MQHEKDTIGLEEKKKGQKSAPDIDGTVVMLWTAVIGILAMMITVAFDMRLTVAIMGITLFICGIAALTAFKITRETYPIIFLPAAGLPMAVIPIYLMLSEHDPVKFPPPSDAAKAAFFGALAIIVGLYMAAAAAVSRIRLKKRCTLEVEAVCVKLVESRSRRGIRVFSSVWEYYAEGQTCSTSEKVSSPEKFPAEGERRTITVNPDKPSEIFRSGDMGYLALIITGICIAAVGVILLAFRG